MRNRSILLALVFTAATLPTLAPQVLLPASPAAAADGCQPPAPIGAAPDATEAAGFHAIAPVRLLDTRDTGSPVGAGCTEVLDLGSGGDEEFHIGIRAYDRADIAAIDHRAGRFGGKIALKRHQSGPDLGNRGHQRGGLADGGSFQGGFVEG